MPRIIVFDVNETLLDLGALDLHFRRLFGAAAVRGEWFTQVIELAVVATATNVYFDFAVVGDAALTMVAGRRGVDLSAEDRAEIRSGMRTLPPHPDVRPGLERLRQAGFRLATLTNSSTAAAEAQLAHAGLRGYFEQVLSVERVRRLKPAPEVYRMAATSLGVGVGEIRLVAAHAWDVAGALRAGCAAAFVSRPGKVLDPLAPRPDVVGPDLDAVAAKLVAVEA
ncbi:MAG TPA: haloacid dehalogenase type II [Gemmatimonadales bacterium]|nr:haloacid dehalogenase type II [Gemmatimonadales bacterium]